MSHFRPPRATLIDREANGGPGVLPARVRPATITNTSPAFAENGFAFERARAECARTPLQGTGRGTGTRYVASRWNLAVKKDPKSGSRPSIVDPLGAKLSN